ncbi:hypothetical protein HOLleu_45020 [Holothuria leucospilota]|uniref:Uncharacterized protein n=1 Tax=Holothuria leucospilota TaxID=206669 RepID=A0A9Q0Y996_HOLLE|nr:hypothetical protein HOLleu_45020 [Holothuria leucospilota]
MLEIELMRLTVEFHALFLQMKSLDYQGLLPKGPTGRHQNSDHGYCFTAYQSCTAYCQMYILLMSFF